MQAREEVTRGLFITGGDGPKLLDEIEESLDEVPLGVEREIAIPFDRAICFWGNDRPDRAHFKALDEAVGVIGFIGEEGFGLHLGGERFGLVDVVDLSACEAERQRVAQGVDDHMDFGGQTAARAAYGLVEAPFLRAPALC